MKGGRDEEAVEKTAPEEPDLYRCRRKERELAPEERHLLGNTGNLRVHRLRCRS
jgi:hypothetical protein